MTHAGIYYIACTGIYYTHNQLVQQYSNSCFILHSFLALQPANLMHALVGYSAHCPALLLTHPVEIDPSYSSIDRCMHVYAYYLQSYQLFVYFRHQIAFHC